ncbi:lactonase family protein [Propionibacteriaceae bacterium Y1923]
MTRTLWVGCMTDDTGHGGLIRLEVDDTRVVEQTGSWDLPSPGWLDTRDGIVYAALHTDDSSVVSMRFTDQGPQVLDRVQTGGADACHLAINPAGRRIAVAHYSSGSVALLGTDPEGDLYTLDLIEFTGSSGAVPDRQQAPHAHHTHWLSDDQLLVCDLGADMVRRLQVVDNRFIEDPPIQLPQGFGPRHLVTRQRNEGVEVAIAGELTGEVAVVRLDLEGHDELVGVFPGSSEPTAQPSGIRLDQRDRLWVGQRNVDTLSLMDWQPDATMGGFTEHPTIGAGVRDLVLSPDSAPVTVWTALKAGNEVRAFVETEHGLVAGEPFTVAAPMALLFADRIEA